GVLVPHLELLGDQRHEELVEPPGRAHVGEDSIRALDAPSRKTGAVACFRPPPRGSLHAALLGSIAPLTCFMAYTVI
ncbi:MAG: hypothetical protein AAB728_00710, partial [Patescibacteria group bacterium]